jgi:hypothetical protein
MSPIFKGKILAVGFIGVVVAYNLVDRGLHYQETEAKLMAVKVDCYIKARKKKLVDKDGNELAHMDCKDAPAVAEHFGFKSSDVRKRAVLKFEFKSPVDGSRQTGEHTDNYATADYKVGQTVKIYAHTTEPAQSRWF